MRPQDIVGLALTHLAAILLGVIVIGMSALEPNSGPALVAGAGTVLALAGVGAALLLAGRTGR